MSWCFVIAATRSIVAEVDAHTPGSAWGKTGESLPYRDPDRGSAPLTCAGIRDRREATPIPSGGLTLLVMVRERDWFVSPQDEPDANRLRPIDGDSSGGFDIHVELEPETLSEATHESPDLCRAYGSAPRRDSFGRELTHGGEADDLIGRRLAFGRPRTCGVLNGQPWPGAGISV